MMLVSLATTKEHLRMDHNAEDGMIELYIHSASAMILNYLKSGADTFLDSSGIVAMDSNLEPIGIPYEVQAATWLLTGYLFRLRDDNDNSRFRPSFEAGYMPAPIISILYPLRDPALA